MTSASGRQDVEVLTFGCRLNLVESEAMRRAALACGRSNLVIVNTCAVTAEAVRQARQAIRRVKRERPGAEIVVTGCAAQIDPAQFAAMPEVFRVLGNADKANPASWARRRRPRGRLQHHGGQGGAGDFERGHRGSYARVSRGADRLRSPLHLLCHSVRTRPVALGAAG